MNACKGYAAGRIWLQVTLVEGRAGKRTDKKPHGPGRMFVFQWGMTLGDSISQPCLWTQVSGDKTNMPFWFFIMLLSSLLNPHTSLIALFSVPFPFNPHLSHFLSLDLWGTVPLLSALRNCHHQDLWVMAVVNWSPETEGVVCVRLCRFVDLSLF